MHRAPVVSISVLDGRGKPLPEPYEASQDLAIAPDMTNAHSVLIASEEQLKVQITRIKTSVRNIQTHLHLYFLLCLPRCSLFLRSAPKQSSSWRRMKAVGWGRWRWWSSAPRLRKTTVNTHWCVWPTWATCTSITYQASDHRWESCVWFFCLYYFKDDVLYCLFIDALFVSSGSIRLHSQRGHQWNCVLCFHQERRGWGGNVSSVFFLYSAFIPAAPDEIVQFFFYIKSIWMFWFPNI